MTMSTPIFDQLLAEFRKTHPGFRLEPQKAALPVRPKLRGLRPAGVILDEATLANEALDNAVHSQMAADQDTDSYFAAKAAWIRNEEHEAEAQASASRARAFQAGWQLGIVPKPTEPLKEAV